MGDSPRLTDVLFGNGPIRAVQEWIGLGHPETFRWLALLGDTWGIMLVLGVAFWLYGRETAYALVGAIALGAVSKLLLSMAFTVPRPAGEEIAVYEQLEISSFPSGHVYQTLIPWGVLYVRERLPLIIPILVVSVVAFSRLYLGVHYLGDLVFAVLFGLLFVWGYVRLFPRVEGWLYRRSAWFYAALVGLGAAGVLASIVFWVDTARRWEILGLVLGTGIALLAERPGGGVPPGRSALLPSGHAGGRVSRAVSLRAGKPKSRRRLASRPFHNGFPARALDLTRRARASGASTPADPVRRRAAQTSAPRRPSIRHPQAVAGEHPLAARNTPLLFCNDLGRGPWVF